MTPCTVAHQGPLPMEFSRQEYWSGVPFPPPGDHPDPGIIPESIVPPALAGGFFTTGGHLYLVEKPVNRILEIPLRREIELCLEICNTLLSW